MDAASRRRELRKRRILQNAEDRINKLIRNVGADVKHEENLDKQTDFGNDNALKLHAHQNVNILNSSTKVDQNCETTTQREKILHGNSLLRQDEPTEMRDKTDGNVRKERVHETNVQQTDESFDDQTTTQSHKEKILENFPKNHGEPTKIQDKTGGYVRKERLHETDQQLIDENGAEFSTVPETVDSKISNVRPVIVTILAMLCFTKSLYLPAIVSILGSSWFLEICIEKEVNVDRISLCWQGKGVGVCCPHIVNNIHSFITLIFQTSKAKFKINHS